MKKSKPNEGELPLTEVEQNNILIANTHRVLKWALENEHAALAKDQDRALLSFIRRLHQHLALLIPKAEMA